MGQKMVKFTVEVNEEIAEGLAQFLKRVSWTEIRQNAVDDVEACIMRDALRQVQRELCNAGFSPR